MSKITFLIGNGFDCACGLKSRYTDSYDGYIHTESSSENIDRFKKTIEKDIKTWADFEMRLADYAHTFKDESELVQCVRDYSSYLNDYLLQEQKAFHESFTGDNVILYALRQTMAEGLARFYAGLTKNDIRAVDFAIGDSGSLTYQFISFNYTDAFDELIKQVFTFGDLNGFMSRSCSNKPIIHIHGQLNNDVILGVDNDSQLVDLPYKLSRRGKRNIIKPAYIEGYDDKRMTDGFTYIRTSNVICAFGLALGESDLTWRKAIAEWLLENRQHHLVYFKHSLAAKRYTATAVMQKMDDEEDYKDQLMGLFFEEPLGAEETDQVYSQIHVPTGFNIFQIKETISSARIESLKRQEIKKSFPKENGGK